MWDDKYGKVWYNSIIQKRTTKDLLETGHLVILSECNEPENLGTIDGAKIPRLHFIPLGMTGVEVESRSVFICEGGSRLEEKLSGQQVLEELRCIAFARVTDYLQVDGGVLRVRDSSELTKQQRAAIAAVEKTSSGMKVKFYDKLKALELLGKAMGLFEGLAVEREDNNLLDAIVLATKKEVDTLDIPEIQQAAAAGAELVEPEEAEGF